MRSRRFSVEAAPDDRKGRFLDPAQESESGREHIHLCADTKALEVLSVDSYSEPPMPLTKQVERKTKYARVNM
jgi:hypothetical protein